jgi:hypothetical protein
MAVNTRSPAVRHPRDVDPTPGSRYELGSVGCHANDLHATLNLQHGVM